MVVDGKECVAGYELGCSEHAFVGDAGDHTDYLLGGFVVLSYVDLSVLTRSKLGDSVAWVGGWKCEGGERDEEEGDEEGGLEMRRDHGE